MTSTFGTITNIQFVANRSGVRETPAHLSLSGGGHPAHLSLSGGGQSSPRQSELSDGSSSPYSQCNNNWRRSPGYGSDVSSITSPPVRPPSGGWKIGGDDYSPASIMSPEGLAVEESPGGALRFATDRPHLVSMGGGRLSTSVTLHPINEGTTTLGAGGMGVVPDIAVIGTGIEPEHCLLEHTEGTVHLTPLAPMVAVDGIRITSKTRLTQGCMICLGRSHFFRFNHPAEAQFMRSVLPSARISMAPIAFYPAVDNPEYFHMSSQNPAVAVENGRLTGDSSPNGNVDGGAGPRPPVPPRKTPPSTLPLPVDETAPAHNRDKVFSFENLCYSPTETLNLNGCNSSPRSSEEGQDEDSADSDSLPEVPPRSEGSCPPYVNSVTSSAATMGTGYLGEYIYTRFDVESSPPAENCPSSGSCSSPTRATGGASTVVCSNGMTTVHNALYRSLPPALSLNPSSPLNPSLPPPPHSPPPPPQSPSSPQSPPSPHVPPPIPPPPPESPPSMSPGPIMGTPYSSMSTTSPESFLRSYSGNPMSPNHSPLSPHYSTPKPPMLVGSGAGASCSWSCSNRGPSSPYLGGPRSPLRTSVEDLRKSERKMQQATEERIREQEVANAEKMRLEEIISLCAEYERQQSGGSGAGGTTTPTRTQNTSHTTLTQNRIKTNGSLPREKRSPLGSPPPSHLGLTSPSGSVPPLSPQSSSSLRAATPSEDELSSIFSFEADPGRCGSLTRSGNLCLYPPFPNLPSGLTGTPSPPPITPRSPYENVVSGQHGYPVPQSPRTRIRTTLGRDRRDFCEIFENKAAVADLGSSLSPKPFRRTTPPKENGALDAPPKPPRSPRIERGVLSEASPIRRGRRGDANVIDNKYFADVTPKGKAIASTRSLDHRVPPTVHSTSAVSSLHLEKGACGENGELKVDSPKIKTKVFEEQMLRNIQDTLNIDDITSEIEKLKEEKDKALREAAKLKTKVTELERQENEALRELEMERALMVGELNSTRDLLKQDQEELQSLLKKSEEMEERHREERERDTQTIDTCKKRLEAAETELDHVEKNDSAEGNECDSYNAQHEALEAEKKIFEDTEFNQMEAEALRESEREELNKEISEMREKTKETEDKISELEMQMADMTSSVRVEAESLESERQELLGRMNKELLHVSSTDRQLAEFARLGVMPLAVPNGRLSPTSSSDTEESGGSELADRLAKLHLLDRSQDDLDRINQVTTSSPLDCNEGTLGRKTSATLMEIEKNRQLTLVKQGTLVINNERRRVEELKKQAALEVKAQWEEQKKAKEQREVTCASLNSVGSEESSLTSSDLHTESLSSDDVIGGQRSSGESVTRVSLKMRQRDNETTSPCSGELSRPMSDASSYCETEGQPVKFREKGRTQQRPLTRYLPVRSEEHFDLRQHIESAGHQIELCPHLTLSSISCRGYLHKLGSKFRTWQKRWFVFDRSKRAFIYYSDKGEGKVRGGTYFQAIEDVYVEHFHAMKSPTPKLTFCVKTHERNFQLMAPSPEAMRIWIDVIFTGAEGYREFQGGT